MKIAALLAVLLLAACARETPGGDAARETSGGVLSSSDDDGDGEFFTVKADEDEGKLLITLPAPGKDGVMLRAIHSAGLTAGLGSNPIGLDRGAGEGGRIVVFRRVGPKVVIEQENWRYRASADNALEKQAVANSFARSFLWSTDVVEENAAGDIVIDLAGFASSDILNVVGALKEGGQGDYAVAADRSFPDYSSVLVFPDNVELDAYLTFTTGEAGGEVLATAADGRAFTLVVHHSFVRLPPAGFESRAFDPRMNGIDVSFYDFSAPLSDSLVQRYARRYRLERVDPSAPSGPVKKPIVFYVDSGAPEQVREALIEGGNWWAEAFEAAGFEDAFRVEILPEGVHPMDVRYNVIQWVHRQTRGWSYGGGVSDPRTGEMLKAYVILGSQRVRQDRMIFEGLAGADKTGTGEADDPVEIALARIRQLSAHEIGHPLGFAHNFAASTNNRASVMDYPAPYVRPAADGDLDFSRAYDAGVGEWDKVAARWLYGSFPEEADEKEALESIIAQAYDAGLKFMDDPQGRPVSGAHPDASVWDNGDDPVAMLEETMEVRRIALENFGAHALRDGQPTSDLRQVIVPIYLYHRYQTAAAAKLVGGYDFRYTVKGGREAPAAPVPANRQRAALDALVATLDPAALDLPDTILDRLTPPLASFGAGGGGETFASDAGPMFDLMRAVDAAGAQTIGALLHPQRLARLVETERRNASALSLEDVLSALEARVFAAPESAREGEIARTLQTRFVSLLIEPPSGGVSSAVEARTDAYLKSLRARLSPGLFANLRSADQAHRAYLAARIEAYLDRPAPPAGPAAPAADVPPGSPIGSPLGEDCWFCDLQ